MKAAVTGATGFLGGGLVCALLTQGWDVDIVVRDAAAPAASALIGLGAQARVVRDPADAFAAVEAAGADAVAHLATHYLRSHEPADIGPLIQANVEFGTGVLEAAAVMSAPVVMASSFFQFSHGRPHPASLYAATKQALSTIGSYYRTERGLDVREVVLYDTYGPGDTRDKLVPLLVGAALGGEEVRLGAADQPINLTYLDDVADALSILLSTASPALTTIRADAPVTVAEIVDAVSSAAGAPLRVRYADGARVSDQPLIAGDWPTPTGWTPRVGLAEGVSRIIAEATSAR